MTRGQADIDANPDGTTFCLSGVHNWTLVPKHGNKFIGPAVLDGGNTTGYAITSGWANNVVVKDLEIRNYRVGAQRGAIWIANNISGWTLQDLQVHDNGTSAGGAGANLGLNWRVIGGRYYNNRQTGLAGAGDGTIIDGVEIDHNNFTNNSYTARTIDCGYEGGGFKWVAKNVTVRNSSIHDNACKGLWSDGGTRDSVITNNHVYNNWNEGIFVEISSGATITGNNVHGNGFHSGAGGGCPWLYGGGITISSSDRAEIAGNTVVGNCNGITGLQQNRPDGNPGLLQHLSIHDNTISGPGGKTGVATDVGTNFSTRNIVFSNNAISNISFCNLTC